MTGAYAHAEQTWYKSSSFHYVSSMPAAHTNETSGYWYQHLMAASKEPPVPTAQRVAACESFSFTGDHGLADCSCSCSCS